MTRCGAAAEQPGWWRWRNGRCLVSVHVQPGAGRTEVVGLHGDRLKVRVAAPAAEDRANRELLRLMAAEFGVPKESVQLLSGVRSRAKRIAIDRPARTPSWLAPAS